MAKGTKEQRATDNANATTYQQNAMQALGLEMPALTQQIKNPGFDPGTANAIRQSAVNPVASAYDAARLSASQRAGATGNETMAYASADDLAQKKAQALSDASLNAETTIGKQALTSQQQAISDASQLYGTSLGAATTSTGQAGQMAAATPSALQNIMSVAGPILQAGGALGSAAIKKCWIAEELYGAGDPRVNILRRWLMFAPKPIHWRIFDAIYGFLGQRIAQAIRSNGPLRELVEMLFDGAVRRAINLNGIS